MVIKKLTIASMWLLGLGSRLYASNMPPMLDKTLHDVHAEFFSSTPKSNKPNKSSVGRVVICKH